MVRRDSPNSFVLEEQVLEVLRMYGIQVVSYVDLPVLFKMSMLENSSKVKTNYVQKSFSLEIEVVKSAQGCVPLYRRYKSDNRKNNFCIVCLVVTVQ